jgi:alpha-tubulin suppressor-like RCC1 family protein
VEAGTYHACAIVRTHAFCWGFNTFGQLGAGDTNSPRLTPGAVGQLGRVGEIATGGRHTCARAASGPIRCWGLNFNGQLGDGTTTDSSLPVPVTD